MNDYKTIYEQRYETYRHLDRLRWFVFQIAISVIVGIIVLKTPGQESALLATGILLFSSGILMAKINYGIDKNNIILQNIGIKIGDNSIPTPKKYKSVSWLIAYSLTLIGAGMLLFKLLQLIYLLSIN